MAWICLLGHKNSDDDSTCFICGNVAPSTLQDRKAQRVADKPVKERKGIKKVSDKRKAETVEYMKLRKVYLEQNPVCEVCGEHPSTQIHHRRGKENGRLLEVQYFLAVDDECHAYIHDNPKFAQAEGYMVNRSKKETI